MHQRHGVPDAFDGSETSAICGRRVRVETLSRVVLLAIAYWGLSISVSFQVPQSAPFTVAWVVLMKRLGYAQFVAQGGDLGAGVCTVMAKHAPPELLGIHTNFPGTIPSDIARALQCGDPLPSGLSPDEKHAYEQLTNLFTKKRAYAQMMATRPQTLDGLADSPVCLAAWLFDHGDGYGQPAAPITSAGVWRTAIEPQ
jgi:hypothetical protein